MLYRFIKDPNGNCVRIGDTTADLLESKLQEYLNNGWSLAQAEEWDQQVIRGAMSVPAADAASSSEEVKTEVESV